MKLLSKHIVAFFLLLIFLLPTTEQVLHSWQHRNDLHCNVKCEKHFHEQEHHCSVCDYEINSALTFSDNNFSTVTHFFVEKLFQNHSTHFLSIAQNPFGARPPPTSL